MTEKRFRVSDVILLTKPNTICDGDIFLNQKEACNLLNKQHEQIQLLQVDKSDLSIDIEVQNEKINRLEEENEQLKQQLNRLYNYFEDWYSDMTSANDFSEIWDNVKEDERWGDVE